MIRENTMYGLMAARERGKRFGRPPSLDEDEIREAHRLVTQEGVPVSEIASRLDVSDPTVRRGFERMGLEIDHAMVLGHVS